MERKEKIARLEELGVEFKKNISNEELDIMLEEAEIEAKAAAAPVAVKKEGEMSASDKASARQNALKLVKCVITPLDDKMKQLPSEMYSVGNKNIGFVKKVVRFGTPTLEPQCIIDLLKEKRALLQQTTEINGKPVTKKVLLPAFAIEELKLTEEEINSVKNK